MKSGIDSPVSRAIRCATILVLGTLVFLLGAPAFQSIGAPMLQAPRQDLYPESVPAVLMEASDSSPVFLPLVLHRHQASYPTLFGVQLYGSITQGRVALDLMRDGRVHWARWPVSWRSIEPTNTTPDGYNWVSDASVLNAYASDLELIITVTSNPDWAATYANGPIDRAALAEFAEFMAALVERYDGDGYKDAPGSPVVNHFELYNEPDAGVEMNADLGHSYWGPFGDQYAAMLCAIYPAMKAANPDVQVVLGGIAYDHFLDSYGSGVFVREFLGDVLAAGGGNCFDVMNFHYYPPFAAVWSPYGAGLSGKVNYLRQNYDLGGKPMMVTEAGWHSEDYSIYPSTPTMQARYVVKLFTEAAASDLAALTWWTWVDPGGGYGPNGLLTADLKPKSAYYAYREAAERIGRMAFDAKVEVSAEAVQAYRFATPSSLPIYVLWSDDATVNRVSLPIREARVVDMYGTLQYVVRDADDGRLDGKITVQLGADPVYVEATR